MTVKKRIALLAGTAAAIVVTLILGLVTGNPLFFVVAVAVVCFAVHRLQRTRPQEPDETPSPVVPDVDPSARPPADPNDTGSLVREMIAQGRYAILLRPQVATTLDADHVRTTHDELYEHMALVPSGEVVLGAVDDALDDGRLDDDEIEAANGRIVSVPAYYLDRYPVTNRQYLEFLVAGGYEQMALWDEPILAAVLDFVDKTGSPGPRFWRHGRFPSGTDNHPVVGVSWYEAIAYARWIGKRLSSDAEWVKAGSWPVVLSDSARLQRKYPWGESMDRNRANIWGSGPAKIVPVTDFAEGVSVGGVYQLVGNVWEWTTGDLGDGHCSPYLSLPTPMKSIRGGAFDTYFENQATCQFQSGENPVARKHNIGFRCAVGVCDVISEASLDELDETAPETAGCNETEEVMA